MKQLFSTFLIVMFAISANSQANWVQVAGPVSDIATKEIVVNDNGVIARFMRSNSGEGFFSIFDPVQGAWNDITGSFSSNPIEDIHLESDGVDFFINYKTTSLDQFVLKIDVAGNITDYSAGLVNNFFSIGPSDFIVDRNTGDMYLVGVNADDVDLNVMGWSAGSWDTLQLSILTNIGVPSVFLRDVSAYVNGQDVFIGFSTFTGNFDEVGLLSSPIGSWNWTPVSGLSNVIPGLVADKIGLSGDGSGFPILVTNNLSAPDSLMYFEYDGGGISVTSGINLGGSTLLNPDVSFKGGKKMVLVSTDLSPNSNKVYEWDGSNFINVHPSSIGVGQNNDPNSSFAQHPVTGRPFVIAEFVPNETAVFTLNHTPTIQSVAIENLCAGESSYILNPIVIDDQDTDSCWIELYSDNQTLILDSDLSADFLNYSGTLSEYRVFCAWSQNSGSVDVIVVVKDGYSSDTVDYPVSIFNTPLIDASNVLGYSLCSNGPLEDLSSLIIPQGGVWSGPAIDQNGIVDPSLAAQNNVIYYDYEDANGCQALDEIYLNVLVPPSIQAEPAIPASCGLSDGTAEISIIQGSSSIYSIIWSTGDTTALVDDLDAGQYVVTVSDTSGCSNFLNYSIASQNITLSSNIIEPNCEGSADGEIDLTVSGDGPFSYFWITGDTSEDMTNLNPGIYSVTITDANGCSSSESFTLETAGAGASQLVISDYVTDATCGSSDGGVTLFISGGSSPYDALWSNGQTSYDLTSVSAGVYDLTLTDFYGCTITRSYTIENLDGPTPYLDSISGEDCNQSNGLINIGVNWSQNPPASFLWSNGSTSQNISGLSAGVYSVTVTDGTGCAGEAVFEVLPVKPEVQPICLVTVDSNTTTNLLVWEKIATSGIDYYNIYRETGAVNNYTLVGTVSANDESIWNDVNASPVVTSWRYKMTQVNSCGTESDLSPHHKTMHVAISRGLGSTYNIFWDDYEGINYPTIDLYRYDQTNGLVLLDTLSSLNNSYTDDPGSDTINLDYFVGFDLVSPCTSSRAQDYNGTRSNRSAGVFDPGNGLDDLSIFENSDLIDDIYIYPNPNSGAFNIVFGNSTQGRKTIRVLDPRGKLVALKTTTSSDYKMNLHHLEDGIYFVEILNGSKKGVKRVIIQ